MAKMNPEEYNKLERVDVVNSSEHWNEYLLEDGNILRLKLTLIKVRMDPSKVDEEGLPNYATKTTQLMDVEKSPSK